MTPAHDGWPVILLEAVRERIRFKHYSIRTEQAYVHWVHAFVRYHDVQHPMKMGIVRQGYRTFMS